MLDEPFVAGVRTPVQYVFDRTRAGGAPPGSQYLAVSLSGASREMGMSVDELRELYVPALRELLPRTRRARLELFLVTREHAATFRGGPGSGSLRPRPGVAAPGLALAGTWTATGWPATLESAVLSGQGAARELMGALEDRTGRAGAGAGGRMSANGVREAVLAAPLRLEALLVASGARGRVIRRTGMGPDRARAASRELSLRSAGALLVVGFCGGLDEGSVPGEVIVAEQVYAASDEGHDETPVSCSLRDELVMRLTGRGLKVRSGDIVCVSRLALGERRAQLHAGGAIAVDMESVWLAGAAEQRPFGVVRVVLDSPSHELMRPGAVFGALRAARALRRVSAALNDMVQGD